MPPLFLIPTETNPIQKRGHAPFLTANYPTRTEFLKATNHFGSSSALVAVKVTDFI